MTKREREFLESDLTELRVLWPRLIAAIGRDSAGPLSSGGGGSTGGVKGSPAPTNMDVSAAIAEIETGCVEILVQVRRLLGQQRAPSAWPRQSGPRFTTDAILGRLPMWAADLEREDQPLAIHIAEDVARWRRSARTALRLSVRGGLLDWICPDHRDRPTRLRRDRDEAELHEAILAGTQPPPGDAPMIWRQAESVHCEHCKRRWKGAPELAELRRETQSIQPERSV